MYSKVTHRTLNSWLYYLVIYRYFLVFADINVSQGSVATYARRGGIFNIHLTANLPGNLPIRNFFNRLRFDRIMVMSLCPRFWPTLQAYTYTP